MSIKPLKQECIRFSKFQFFGFFELYCQILVKFILDGITFLSTLLWLVFYEFIAIIVDDKHYFEEVVIPHYASNCCQKNISWDSTRKIDSVALHLQRLDSGVCCCNGQNHMATYYAHTCVYPNECLHSIRISIYTFLMTSHAIKISIFNNLLNEIVRRKSSEIL